MPQELAGRRSGAGSLWLPALDNEGTSAIWTLATWHEAVRVRVKSLYTTMRTLYEQIAPAGTFLVSATRLGGQHGYDEAGAVAPLGGAVVGFTKAYKRERPDALVKAVDFEAGPRCRRSRRTADRRNPARSRRSRDRLQGRLRWTVGLQEQPAADGQPGLTLDKNTVFLITGAAGSIVSAITADLAAASGGTFYLLDLVPEPDPTIPTSSASSATKKASSAICSHAYRRAASGPRRRWSKRNWPPWSAHRPPQSAIDAVRAAGGTPHYFSVNLTDADAVAKVIDQVRAAQRPHRRAVARRRHRAQPLPAGQGPARIRSGLRRQERRLVQSAACHRRHAARRDRGVQLDRRPLRQRRADGLQLRQRSAVQDHLELPHHSARTRAASPSIGPRGAASAWPRAAPSRR